MTMILVLIGIILGSVGLDQLTKLLAVQYLKPTGLIRSGRMFCT